MKLRVAHVLNAPGSGGVPRVAHALVRHADPDRIAPHLFYLKPGTGPDLFDDIDMPRRAAASGSKALAMTELVAWLDSHRIDILHTHSYRPNLYARMAGAVLRHTGLKIVAHYHNDYSDKWTGDALVLERRLASVTDAGLAVSEAVAGHVADRVGLTADVLENGIDLQRVTGGDRRAGRRALGLPAGDPVVGLVGRVCWQKGVDTFVDAALELCARGPAAHFVVVGDHEDATLVGKLRARIAAAGLEDRITLAGYREDMADVLAALDLLVAPSRWEGFGLALAEAMAAGVPVVASAVGGIPSVTGHAARLVPPDDARALACEISALLTDPAARDAMRTAGLAQAKRFHWAGSAAKLEAHYNRLGARV